VPPPEPPPADPATTVPDRVGDDVRPLADVADIDDAKPQREYDPFVAAALDDIEAWLQVVYPEVYGEPFEPLQGGVYPVHPDRTDVPGCGGTSTRYRDVVEYGAFYCSVDDFIVYDDGDDGLLGELVDEFGPAALGVVLAHEYAHAVQQRTGDLARGLPTVILEQHADCLAGSWIDRVAGGSSDLVLLTDGDVRGTLITMVAVRDPAGIDQFSPGGHGSAFDRIGAFQEGFRNGPGRCAEIIDEPLPLMPNQFQSATDLANDGDLPFGYDEGQIVPLIVDSLNAYWAFELGRRSISFTPMRLVPVATTSDLPCTSSPIAVVDGLVTCAADGTVYVDDAVARALYDDPIEGRADFAVGYLVALAWADRVQTLLGSDLAGAERALADDCLVGAWTLDLDPGRPPRPDESDSRGTISPGDLDEAVLAAIQIGDPDSGTDRLGSAFEKVDSFRSGVLGGLETCIERIEQ
jgi:predicted metalloprotease